MQERNPERVKEYEAIEKQAIQEAENIQRYKKIMFISLGVSAVGFALLKTAIGSPEVMGLPKIAEPVFCAMLLGGLMNGFFQGMRTLASLDKIKKAKFDMKLNLSYDAVDNFKEMLESYDATSKIRQEEIENLAKGIDNKANKSKQENIDAIKALREKFSGEEADTGRILELKNKLKGTI